MPNWTPVSHYTRKNYLPLSKRVDDEDYDSDEDVGTFYNPIMFDTTSDESESDRDDSPSESSDSEDAPAPQPRRLYAWLYPSSDPPAPVAPVAPVVPPTPPTQPAQEACWMCHYECHYQVAPAFLPRLESMDEVLREFN